MNLISKCTLSALATLLITSSASVIAADKKLPLYLYIFVHDDIPAEDRTSLKQDYLSWATKEIESITHRTVHLEFIENDPSMTRFPYPGDDKKVVLDGWTRRVDSYIANHPQPLNKRYKYLLLTKHEINFTTLGVAAQGNYSGIASIKTYQAPAHEIGHMLGATHEAAQINYAGGWWCGTIMNGNSAVLSNCYVYSEKNREAIADYLKYTR